MTSKTLDSGNGGTVQLIVDLVSQSSSGNYSKIRVRGILKNVSTSTSYVNDARSITIGGSVSWSGSSAFNLSAGESKTIADENFNVTHNSDGTKSITVTLNMADTGTWTFGNPPTVSVSMTLPALATAPDKIDDLTRSFVAPTTIKLDWTAPPSNRSSIDNYQVRWDSNSSFSSPAYDTDTPSSRTITGLSRGQSYWFAVRAHNGEGYGPWTSSVSYSIPNIPDPVAAPVLTFTAPQTIKADWVAPDNNGASITRYDMQYASNSQFLGATTVTDAGGEETISGLAMGTTWYFRARATNSQGTSAWGSARSYAIPNLPSAVGVPTTTYTPPNTVKIAWSAPASNGSAIVEYQVQYDDNPGFSSPTSVSAGKALTLTVSNVTIGPTWYFRVRARNGQGWGPFSLASSELIVCGPQVNVSGTYKNTVAYVNVGGVWKLAIPYVNVAGVWKIAGG